MRDRIKKTNQKFSMFLILLSTVFFFVNNHILTVAIPLLIKDMNFDLSLIGICTATMGVMTILTKFITPNLMSRVKLNKLILWDLGFLVVVNLGLLIYKSSVSIIVFRTLFGIPFSIFPILNLVAITIISSDPESVERNTSLIGMAMPLSMMVSPAITEFTLTHFNYQIVFLIALISCLFSLVLYQLGLSKINQSNKEYNENYKKTSLSLAFKELITINSLKPIKHLIVCFFFLGIADMLILTYYPLLASSSSHSYSLFFSIFSVSMVLSQYLFCKIKLSNKLRLIIGYTLLAISSLLIGLKAQNLFYYFSVFSSISFGFGYSFVETTTNSIVLSQVEKGKTESFVTIQQLSICLGRTIGPWIISFFSSSNEQLRLCFLILSSAQIIPIILISTFFHASS